MPFSNLKINPHELPQIEASQYDALEAGYKKVINVENIILGMVLLGGILTLYFLDFLSFLGRFSFVPILGVFLFLVFIFWFRIRAFAKKGYQVRQHDIIYKNGLWWQNEVAIPFVRVQHSEITQGPIGRYLGFSTLKLYTAGGNQSDLSIPALLPETAEKLKAFIAQKSIQDED